jgi:hypothetical protein
LARKDFGLNDALRLIAMMKLLYRQSLKSERSLIVKLLSR